MVRDRNVEANTHTSLVPCHGFHVCHRVHVATLFSMTNKLQMAEELLRKKIVHSHDSIVTAFRGQFPAYSDFWYEIRPSSLLPVQVSRFLEKDHAPNSRFVRRFNTEQMFSIFWLFKIDCCIYEILHFHKLVRI